MRLISLELNNFRQHVDSRIDFADGLTGIIGPNGAGKTTILEAIAWALYGAPAVRGNNDTIRSNAAEGGSKARVALTFELSGAVYKVTRTLDGSGRSGTAVLEADGRALRSGMSDVTSGIAHLLGMDYQAFFTSFFTGQKQLEFMAQLEGRQRVVAISRMLGYDRLTKARDQANEDRKGLDREIVGLERGLPDPEELKQRKRNATESEMRASNALSDAEKSHLRVEQTLEKLRPLKELSDQKSRRYDDLSRRLENDRSETARCESRLNQVRGDLDELARKRDEFASLRDQLSGFREAGEEYKKLAELSKYEGDRQRLGGELASHEKEITRLNARAKALSDAEQHRELAVAALSEAESALLDLDRSIQTAREQRLGAIHGLDAQIRHLESVREDVESKRARIAQEGEQGKCPTCERPLAHELGTVLGNFDAQIRETAERIESLRAERDKLESDTAESDSLARKREKLAAQVDELRARKENAEARVVELNSISVDLRSRLQEADVLRSEIGKLPAGFNRERFEELDRLRESLQPLRERAAALKSDMERAPRVEGEAADLKSQIDARKQEIAAAEEALRELAFSAEEHEKLVSDYETALAELAAAALFVERQRGELNTARAILQQIELEEESYRSRVEELKRKRSERVSLETLADALDKLRGELNDRIRPELETAASELLSMMTDGRYNVLEISDNYTAMIRDDGELKPVISGGEDDIVNLALRLAISQMIADRSGQSFSLLVLDEVFGSLDDVRRDNVVSLLQNLKNRFEQIVLITHVESVHDAVDNCLWVEFDERQKTSRLTNRSDADQPEVGTLV